LSVSATSSALLFATTCKLASSITRATPAHDAPPRRSHSLSGHEDRILSELTFQHARQQPGLDLQ